MVVPGFAERPAVLERGGMAVAEYEIRLDGNDMLATRVFVLKSYAPGTYPVRAVVSRETKGPADSYVADLVLGEATYYQFSWSPSTYVYPNTYHVGVRPVSASEFRNYLRSDFALPSCTASPRGVSYAQ